MSPLPRFLRGLSSSSLLWSLTLITVLGIAGNTITAAFSNLARDSSLEIVNGKQIELGFGGPDETTLKNDESAAVLKSSDFHVSRKADKNNEDSFSSETSSLIGLSSPGAVANGKVSIAKYRAAKGDTVEKLSLKFNISQETIEWANPGIVSGIKPGQSIIILPVSGVLHEVDESDTLKTVANLFSVKNDLIRKYNPNYENIFEVSNGSLIIPYASPALEKTSIAGEPKNLRYYFTLPARGWNWGVAHYNNAVDIADSCGSQIYSAQEGIITEESGVNSWNDGYGNYIVIEHPNGTRTKYAHNQKNLVKTGAYVRQGDPIALIGSTGKTHGVTGCHLHFEVLGAKNPFAIQ